MKFSPVFLLLLLGAVLVATACVSSTPQTTQSPAVPPIKPLTAVKVAYLPVISNGPLFIAQDEGYFARQGIAVEFVKFQSASAALPSLINGDIAVSGGALSPSLMNAMSSDIPVRIVADKGRNAPGSCNASGIMVRRDLLENGTVTKVADLKGRKVMTLSDQAYRISRILALGNLTSSDITMVSMDFPSGVVALRNGAVDAADMTEPYITQLEGDRVAVMLFPTEFSTPGYPTPLFYGPAFLDRDPELGRKFMVAYLEGARQYNQGKTERNIAILANYTHLDKDLLKRSCWLPVDPAGDLPAGPVHDYFTWTAANQKDIRVPADDQAFNRSFVEYANGVLANTTPTT